MATTEQKRKLLHLLKAIQGADDDKAIHGIRLMWRILDEERLTWDSVFCSSIDKAVTIKAGKILSRIRPDNLAEARIAISVINSFLSHVGVTLSDLIGCEPGSDGPPRTKVFLKGACSLTGASYLIEGLCIDNAVTLLCNHDLASDEGKLALMDRHQVPEEVQATGFTVDSQNWKCHSCQAPVRFFYCGNCLTIKCRSISNGTYVCPSGQCAYTPESIKTVGPGGFALKPQQRASLVTGGSSRPSADPEPRDRIALPPADRRRVP